MQHLTTADGARIAYDDIGSGRPLVLLHGLMAHHGFFHRQHPLAERFRLILVDLRGHGESRDGAGGGLAVETMAADIAALAEQLDLHDAIGIGWSLGAAILWHVLAGPASHRFAGAVVVDMTPRVRNGPDWELGLSPELCAARAAAIEQDFPSFAAAAARAIFAGPAAEADWAAAEFARNDPAAIGALWESLVEQDFRDALGRIEQPTLIVHGAHSHLYDGGTAEHLARALPRARAIRFDRSGHAPHIEQPELFNQAIADFAASLPRVRDPQTA
ncbi:MAG TPA: alpha/beta hydrolase [Allosphingosinicella sp.]